MTKKKRIYFMTLFLWGCLTWLLPPSVTSAETFDNPRFLSSEDQIKAIIKQTVLEYIDPTQFERVEMTKYEGTDPTKQGKYVVTLYLQTQKGKTTKDAMVYVLKEIKKTGKAILTVGNHKISDIVYCIDGKLEDPYGNINDGLWFRVDMPGSKIYKIKSSDITLSDLLRLVNIEYATKDAKKIFSQILD